MSDTLLPEGRHVVEYDEGDPTVFINRYPKPTEVLHRGGREGVEYCYVSGERIGYFSRLQNDEGDVWSLIKPDKNSEDVPTLTIKGPKGVDDSVVLMGRGKPIPGGDDHNGVRKFYVDVILEEKVGIPANPDSPVSTTNLPDGQQVQAETEGDTPRHGAALGKGKKDASEAGEK